MSPCLLVHTAAEHVELHRRIYKAVLPTLFDACFLLQPVPTFHTLQAEDGSWQWRTNLAASSPYWRGWYEGLSDAFLALPVPKMLLLAGTDR